MSDIHVMSGHGEWRGTKERLLGRPELWLYLDDVTLAQVEHRMWERIAGALGLQHCA